MLRRIEFKNYRGFSEKQVLDIAPVTVIFGKNNSGKSAVMKLPALVANWLECKCDEVFQKSTDSVEICDNYSDVVYGRGSRGVYFKAVSDSEDSIEIEFSVDSNSDPSTHVEYFKLSDNKGNVYEIRRDIDSGEMKYFNEVVELDGGIPAPVLRSSEISEWSFGTLQRLHTFSYLIGAMRAVPQRYFYASENRSSVFGYKGEYIYDILIADAQRNCDIIHKVGKWYKENFENWEFTIDRTREPVYSAEMRKGNISVNLLDTGVGIVQSLPILVSSAVKGKIFEKTIIGFEEPESHLHPEAHAEIGEYIADNIISSGRYAMIETHSVNLILRLRLMVAQGRLKKEDLALYFVDTNPESPESTLRKIDVDDKGRVDWWPEGVFSETMRETLALHQIQFPKK